MNNPAAETSDLKRELTFFSLFAAATGTMIGAGIFILPGVAATAAGPAAALSFLFAGVIAFVTAISTSELATALPKAGGSYFFVSRAMGPLLGAVVGLGAWVALMFKGAFALVGIAEYIDYFSPVPIMITAVVAGLLLLAVNCLGAKISGILQNIIVIALIAILGYFMTKGLMSMDPEKLTPFMPNGLSSVFATTGLVLISYSGITKAAAAAEEVANPDEAIPKAIIGSVSLVTVLYVVTMLIVTGIVPMADLATIQAPLAAAGAIFLGASGAIAVAVAGLLATTSTGNAAILLSSRFPFAMARDGLMHERLSNVSHRTGTPIAAIAATGLLMVVFVILFDVAMLAKLGGAFTILIFTLMNMAVVLLRRLDPPWYQPRFRSPLVPWIQVGASVFALALIPTMGWMPILAMGLFTVAGVAWYRWFVRMHGKESIQPNYGLADQVTQIRELRMFERANRLLAAAQAAQAGKKGPQRRRGYVTPVIGIRKERMAEPGLMDLAGAVSSHTGFSIDALSHAKETNGGDQRARSGVILLDAHEDTRVYAAITELLAYWAPETLLTGDGESPDVNLLPQVAVIAHGEPYSQVTLQLAGSLAAVSGAPLLLLLCLPRHTDRAVRRNAEQYLKMLEVGFQGNVTAEVVWDDMDRPKSLLVSGKRPMWIVQGVRHNVDDNLLASVTVQHQRLIVVHPPAWNPLWTPFQGTA